MRLLFKLLRSSVFLAIMRPIGKFIFNKMMKRAGEAPKSQKSQRKFVANEKTDQRK